MKRLILFSLLLFFGCTKEEEGMAIKPGCKPSSIEISDSTLGTTVEKYTESFTYVMGNISQQDGYTFEYQDGLVSKISHGTSKYESFVYDDENRVVSSIQYKKENEEEDFQLTNYFDYEYEGNFVKKSINKLYSKEVIFYRNSQTSNIDSLISFDSNGEISKIEYFEYDDKPNIYTNFCSPQFNFDQKIINTTRNNILNYKKYKPNTSSSEEIGYTVDIIYNESDFPSTITIEFSSGMTRVRNITYVDCN